MTLVDHLGTRALGLGTAGFIFNGSPTERSLDTIATALDGGIRLIDTARAYSRIGEESSAEALVAEALRSDSEGRALVATKGGHWREGESFPIRGDAATLRRHCHDSLSTLGIERIELYQLHHVDPAVPLGESVAALRDLGSEGLIRRIGLSNVSLAQVREAESIAPIAAVQNRLSLGRPVDHALLRHCERSGIAFLAYSPLGGRGAAVPPVVEAVARRHAASSAQVMLAWLFAQSASVVPLVGATRAASVRDALAARDLTLSVGDLLDLDEGAPGE